MYIFKKMKESLEDECYEIPRIGPALDREDPHPILWPEYIENPLHPFTFCSSLTIKVNNEISNNFSGSDDYENFLNNLRKQPFDWHYRTKQIVYNVNNSGYRTREWDDIDWKESIILLGDSCTFGIGLAEDETISHFLSKLTGRNVVNLGFPAGSNQLIVNNLATLINKFPIPYGIVVNWSTTDRLRIYAKHGYYEIGPWDQKNTDIEGIQTTELYKNLFINEYNTMGMNYYIGSIAKALAKDRTRYISISYFPDSAHYTRSEKFFRIDNQARDLIHPGRNNSLEVAEYIKNRLNR
jgi:hypothetical protein